MSAPKQPNLDAVTTINADGSRYFLHPADVRGKWTWARRLTGIVLILIYALLPWIPINGAPAVFLDVENRLFHVFGLTLVPQDLWVLFFCITGLGFTLYVVTSIMGRIWCGWTCPYTVFIDHVFRRIERVIEGDAQARKQLDAAPWSAGKVVKRVVKHALYVVCAAIIAHIFLSYFVSLERLYGFMHQGPMNHMLAFGVVTFLTLVLWFTFGYFREQFCIIMCPYGRLQSALTDDDTINVGYDYGRGEPRGAKGKAEGDCIDCRRCVQVCPTGIDIRNGLQLECIGCAACIDACDDIMKKIERPTGLVRYDSFNAFRGEKKKLIRPRVFIYAAFLLLGAVVFGIIASQRARPINVTISRPGAAPFYNDATSVRNLYSLRIMNKRNQPVKVTVALSPAPAGYALSGTTTFELGAQKDSNRVFSVIAPHESYEGAGDISFTVTAEPGHTKLVKTTRFNGPARTAR